MTSIALTKHYIQRVVERLPGVRPAHLARAFSDAIDANHCKLEYLGRSKWRGRVSRRFATTTDCGSRIVAVVSDDDPRKLVFLTAYIDDGRR